MTPNTQDGDGTGLSATYAHSTSLTTGIAKRLLHTLFIWRCEGVVVNAPSIAIQNPRVHLTVENLLHLTPNNAVIANGMQADTISCLRRAGMLSNFREVHVFGTDEIKSQRQINRGHLYL